MEKFTKRVSVRDYTNEKITEDQIKTLTDVINNSPTSTNTQQFSAIIITDEKMKEFISQRNYFQSHIKDAAGLVLFMGDRTRMQFALGDIEVSGDIAENEFMRATIDASIASAYTQDALIEMGFGTAYIGGLPSYGDELAKVIKAPETAFFVVGLAFGKASKLNDFKPKMNKVFTNEYDIDKNTKEFVEYDKTMDTYYKERNQETNFMEMCAEMNKADGKYAKSFSAGGAYFNKTRKNFK